MTYLIIPFINSGLFKILSHKWTSLFRLHFIAGWYTIYDSVDIEISIFDTQPCFTQSIWLIKWSFDIGHVNHMLQLQSCLLVKMCTPNYHNYRKTVKSRISAVLMHRTDINFRMIYTLYIFYCDCIKANWKMI